MTPHKFRCCLQALDLHLSGLADTLGEDIRLVRRWNSGTRPIPEPVACWLITHAAFALDNPPPMRGKGGVYTAASVEA